LRQDPDVIMVGEIRDTETARVAVQAALTGHLVLSTLHTNDSPGAITRLLDMGVASYQLAAALVGVTFAASHLGIEHAQVHLASRRVPLPQLWANGTAVGVLAGVASWVVLLGLYLAARDAVFGGLPGWWIVLAVAQIPLLLHVLYWVNLLQLGGRLLSATGAGLAGVVAHGALVAMLFAGATRYRVPWDFLIAIMAAAGIDAIAERVARQRAYSGVPPRAAT
jgi:hypothetical protein